MRDYWRRHRVSRESTQGLVSMYRSWSISVRITQPIDWQARRATSERFAWHAPCSLETWEKQIVSLRDLLRELGADVPVCRDAHCVVVLQALIRLRKQHYRCNYEIRRWKPYESARAIALSRPIWRVSCICKVLHRHRLNIDHGAR